MKHLFSNKPGYNANTKLTNKDEIIQNDENVAEILNSFFKNAVSSLKLNENSFFINKEHKNIQDPIDPYTNTFGFKHLMLSDIENEIKGLNPNEATTYNNISPKILWQSAEVTANTLELLYNNAISNREFPEN